MKKIGEFNGTPVYEDPNAPPGKMFFLNDKFMEFSSIDTRSRWQRLKDWLKQVIRRVRK